MHTSELLIENILSLMFRPTRMGALLSVTWIELAKRVIAVGPCLQCVIAAELRYISDAKHKGELRV